MGAILRLRKMPESCNKCPLADKEVKYCRARKSTIIAGKERSTRMPLCPLENEGKYLSNFVRKANKRVWQILLAKPKQKTGKFEEGGL